MKLRKSLTATFISSSWVSDARGAAIWLILGGVIVLILASYLAID